MKITFMGSPKIGSTVLTDLLENDIKIDSVITQPDKPKGRSKKPEMTEVKKVALTNDIKAYEPKSKTELTKVIDKIKPDLCIVAAYGMMIPNEALDIPKHGMINFHPSLLPKLRGPAPISMAIMCGDKKTGVSIIQIAEKMDAGDILSQKEICLDMTETTPELSTKLAHVGSQMIGEIIPKIESGEIDPTKQDDKEATFTKLIKKADGEVSFKKYHAKNIEQTYRAFIPWPGVFTKWNDKKIDLFDIKLSQEKIKPGKIVARGNEIIVGCAKGSISIGSLKIEGKNKVTAEEFLRGYPKFIGSVLS